MAVRRTTETEKSLIREVIREEITVNIAVVQNWAKEGISKQLLNPTSEISLKMQEIARAVQSETKEEEEQLPPAAGILDPFKESAAYVMAIAFLALLTACTVSAYKIGKDVADRYYIPRIDHLRFEAQERTYSFPISASDLTGGVAAPVPPLTTTSLITPKGVQLTPQVDCWVGVYNDKHTLWEGTMKAHSINEFSGPHLKIVNGCPNKMIYYGDFGTVTNHGKTETATTP